MNGKVTTVVGARPQFIKCALLSRELRRRGFSERLIHTGQHYSNAMSNIFFEELGIPEPDANLGIGSDTHGRQTGRMMLALDEELETNRPDMVIVFGDTNSTLAAALCAVKMHIPLLHVEAGMRSRDRTMPEEHNRVVTDHVADLLVCHNQQTAAQLEREQVQGKILVCGDIMRQAQQAYLPLARERSHYPACLNLKEGEYAVLTVHRPVNADHPAALMAILSGANQLGLPVVFPAHPRTLGQLMEARVGNFSNVRLIEPLGYLDMMALVSRARLVLTDSGGLQKESAFLNIPCVTLRSETEWRETLELELNWLTGDRPSAERIAAEVERALANGDAAGADAKMRESRIAEYFGPLNVAERIVDGIELYQTEQASRP